LAANHGFVQNEGLAYEVAARFYSGRGFDTIAMLIYGMPELHDRWARLAR